MTRDPIATVARLRRLARDEARLGLSRALATETEAARLADQATRDIADESAAATSLIADDSVVEAFAAWLPVARQRAAEARAACDRAGAEVARWRAVLTASRSASEAVDTLIADRAAAAAQDRARRTQAELDDAGRPRPDG